MNRHTPLLTLPLILLVVASSSCTTIENRRDLYFPQTVQGPYTRMKNHGIPKTSAYDSTVVSRTDASSDGKSVIKPQN